MGLSAPLFWYRAFTEPLAGDRPFLLQSLPVPAGWRGCNAKGKPDVATVCPYGTIRTNRKPIALQWMDMFSLILFPIKPVFKCSLFGSNLTMVS